MFWAGEAMCVSGKSPLGIGITLLLVLSLMNALLHLRKFFTS